MPETKAVAELPRSDPDGTLPPEDARAPESAAPARVIGRYAVYGEIGSGGMATVYFGRLRGAGGFSRPVAIKRLHPHFAKTPRFVDAFLDEARLAAQIRHPNVVPTLDVVNEGGELLLVMEYIAGASLSELWEIAVAKNGGHGRIAPAIAASVVAGALHGLHAAHEAKDDDGQPLSIVHRDVSPHNVIVGVDGVARVLDFGVAKAEQRIRTTNPGEVKGKLAYMAPEQIMLEQASARSDIYSAGVMLWEALTGEWLFRAENHGSLISKILSDEVKPPSAIAPDVPKELDAIVLKALARNAEERYASANEMAQALEEHAKPASARVVSEWVASTAGEAMARRAAHAAVVERAAARPSSDVLWDVTDDSALEGKSPSSSTQALDATPSDAPPPDDDAVAPPIANASGDGIARADDAKSKRGVWIALLILAMGAFGVVAWYLSAAQEPPRAIAPAATTTTGSATAITSATATATTPPVASTAAISATTASTAPTATASTAAASATAGAPTHVTTATASTPTIRHTAAARPDCSPPFTIDADGIKHLKRECL